jgi:hypothetical protein
MNRYPLTARRVAAILMVWLIPSCSETPREQYERRLRQAEKPQQHAVHSDRLLELMAQLKHLTYSRLPQELESADLEEQRLGEIRWIARGMASAAAFIPEVLADVEMDPERAREFRELSSRLEEQCRTLEAMSAQGRGSALGLVTEFSAILDTCDRCHTRFRVLPRVRGQANE